MAHMMNCELGSIPIKYLRVPISKGVQKARPGRWKCVWCGMNETCDHIILRCIVARFTWSALREALRCGWNQGRCQALGNGGIGRGHDCSFIR